MRLPPRPSAGGHGRTARHRAVSAAIAGALLAAVPVAGSAASATSLPAPPSCPGLSEQYPTASAGYGIPIANRIVNGVLTEGTSVVTNINANICGILTFPALTADIPASQIQYINPANLTVNGVLDVGTVDITADGPSTAVTASAPAANGGLVFTLTAHAHNVVNIGNLSTLALPSLPGVSVPPISLPGVSAPAVTVPSATVPALGASVPGVSLPGISIPSVSIPSVSIPSVSIPSVSIPSVSIPSVSIPSVSIPSVSIPSVSIPTVTLPALPSVAVSCDTQFDGTFFTDSSNGGSPLVGPLTGAQGTAYAPDGSASLSALTPDNPSNLADSTLCPILSQLLGTQSSTTVSFKAPLDFYSTLTSFP